ncbi:phospholipase C accessory protein PlcR [Pseudomonas piscis]|uniref:phospholipase C accessory protein PlcR n=1 Tax=Pseudomonas piscis TaxID=2614538 RepID=UPI0021D5A5AD|nr:phospholipase C accessory protein PlcR [Pseudomonas piscis]MCU7646551.1 phospholipase C accessory protein PlcR [Pseudomonas piscis]
MKAILLAVCAALIAYLVLFRQPVDTVVEQAPGVASRPVSNTTSTVPAPAADSQAPASLEQEIAAFSQTASTLPAAERRQVAERLINELKTSVSNGEDLKSAYAQVERLTPNIESDPKSLESLNYSIWMDMKDHATPPAPPSPAQRQQLDTYQQAANQAIDEVLKTVDGDEARRAAIEEKLKALRLEIFGSSAPQPLSH